MINEASNMTPLQCEREARKAYALAVSWSMEAWHKYINAAAEKHGESSANREDGAANLAKDIRDILNIDTYGSYK
jgi:hypothetical protein